MINTKKDNRIRYIIHKNIKKISILKVKDNITLAVKCKINLGTSERVVVFEVW